MGVGPQPAGGGKPSPAVERPQRSRPAAARWMKSVRNVASLPLRAGQRVSSSVMWVTAKRRRTKGCQRDRAAWGNKRVLKTTSAKDSGNIECLPIRYTFIFYTLFPVLTVSLNGPVAVYTVFVWGAVIFWHEGYQISKISFVQFVELKMFKLIWII